MSQYAPRQNAYPLAALLELREHEQQQAKHRLALALEEHRRAEEKLGALQTQLNAAHTTLQQKRAQITAQRQRRTVVGQWQRDEHDERALVDQLQQRRVQHQYQQARLDEVARDVHDRREVLGETNRLLEAVERHYNLWVRQQTQQQQQRQQEEQDELAQRRYNRSKLS